MNNPAPNRQGNDGLQAVEIGTTFNIELRNLFGGVLGYRAHDLDQCSRILRC